MNGNKMKIEKESESFGMDWWCSLSAYMNAYPKMSRLKWFEKADAKFGE